jgi:Effector Associated Constant Component 1
VPTDLVLSVETDDPVGDTEELLDWLRAEPELRRLVRPVTQALPPGHMGAFTEIAVAAVSGGGVLTVLAMSLKTWLGQARKSDVNIRIREPGGREIELSLKRGSVADTEALLAELRSLQQD